MDRWTGKAGGISWAQEAGIGMKRQWGVKGTDAAGDGGGGGGGGGGAESFWVAVVAAWCFTPSQPLRLYQCDGRIEVQAHACRHA